MPALKSRHLALTALILCTLFLLGIGLGVWNSHFFSEDAKFQNFTEKLFQAEAGGSTLNLHYTLANPEKYQIRQEEISLGDVPADPTDSYEQMERYEETLKSFSYEDLSRDNQLTLDLLLLFFHTERSLGDNYLLEEPLSPSLGIQAQLPVLLAEYAFYDKQDITDYLKLLTCVEDYFQQILEFEKAKSEAGLFRGDTTLDRILEQCQSFLSSSSENCLLPVFEEKIQEFPGLSAKEKESCIASHKKIIENSLIPAYEHLMSGLETLRGTGRNSAGLRGFEHGREYYQYLLRSQVGIYASPESIEKRLYRQLETDYKEMSGLLQENPDLLLRISSEDLPKEEPETILKDLESLYQKDFPALDSPEYEVKYVHESMEDFLSPAFYLTPPIDTQTPNTIYINRASTTSNLELFTTLAHEGFPGHLYQTVYFSRENVDPVRHLFTCGGYIEGWATYVESYAYGYADADPALTRLLWLNRSINLNLYCLLDIGIHYHGWDLSQVTRYLRLFGITDQEAAREIFQYIIETPANYLRYYVGYLGFCDLKNAAEKEEGNSFQLKEFHRKVLEIGPAPFPILQKYLLSGGSDSRRISFFDPSGKQPPHLYGTYLCRTCLVDLISGIGEKISAVCPTRGSEPQSPLCPDLL